MGQQASGSVTPAACVSALLTSKSVPGTEQVQAVRKCILVDYAGRFCCLAFKCVCLWSMDWAVGDLSVDSGDLKTLFFNAFDKNAIDEL